MNFILNKPNSLSDVTCSCLISTFNESKNKIITREIETIQFSSDLFRWRSFDSILYKELSACLKEYMDTFKDSTDIFTNAKLIDNGFFIQKLNKNKGHYDFHNDFYSSEKNYRILTYIWFLNDIESGGELIFWNNKEKITPKKGTLVLFPSSWTFSYKHTYPLNEDQYIVIGGVFTN